MRSLASRLLLLALVAVAVAAVVRVASGPGGALVALDGLGADALAHRSFRLDAPGAVAVDAVGSYEEAGSPGADTTMAATAWIVRRDDGAVVWRLRPPRPASGTLVAAADTVALAPGTYDAYFASFGDPSVRAPGPRDGSLGERVRAFLSRGGRSWVGEAGRWRLRVDPLDAGARAATAPASPRDPARAEPAPDSLRVWEVRGARNGRHHEGLISVTAPSRVVVRSVTEVVDGEVVDRPSIVRLGDRDTVWAARAASGVWAGGSAANRVVRDTVALAPGLYRVAFDASRSHGYGGWAATPPWRPWEWGLELRRAGPGDAVSPLDPAALDLPVLVSFECVGPDADRQATLDVPSPTDVLVVAVGEFAAGVRYDWATLDRRAGGGWGTVWEMGEHLTPAGGDPTNRRETQALRLDPGTYRLRYRTDGRHDCVTGTGGADAWGAVLYALDPDADPAAFGVRPVPDRRPAGAPANGLLAAVDSVGDGQDRTAPFSLAAAGDVWVVATAEVSATGPLDTATIERDGAVVWRTTRENTVPAGSDLDHRLFEGPVPLPAGDYVVRYRTNESRSFGDFGPDSRVLWGARVYDRAPPR